MNENKSRKIQKKLTIKENSKNEKEFKKWKRRIIRGRKEEKKKGKRSKK